MLQTFPLRYLGVLNAMRVIWSRGVPNHETSPVDVRIAARHTANYRDFKCYSQRPLAADQPTRPRHPITTSDAISIPSISYASRLRTRPH
ncbi:hypothetical protein Zmor_004275 [Zophobas morio]|uniref:Uncharacterized protein n=1 Tax=Zophobas morio TaxID=2755281 RepID=A0AA38HJ30_9CUCU|nr:hypothetical protein Zmor_004275 [Zophobas morio]